MNLQPEFVIFSLENEKLQNSICSSFEAAKVGFILVMEIFLVTDNFSFFSDLAALQYTKD